MRLVGVRVSKALIFLDGGAPTRSWPSFDVRGAHLVPIANRPLRAHPVEGLERAGVEHVGIAADQVTLAATREALATHRIGVRTTYIPGTNGGGAVEACPPREASSRRRDGHPHGDAVLGLGLGGVLGTFESQRLDALMLLEPAPGRARRDMQPLVAGARPAVEV